MLEGQISTAWAHLKGKASKVNTNIFLRSKRSRLRCSGSQVLNSQQLREGVHGDTPFILRHNSYAERETRADSSWSPPSLADRSPKSLTREENSQPRNKTTGNWIQINIRACCQYTHNNNSWYWGEGRNSRQPEKQPC